MNEFNNLSKLISFQTDGDKKGINDSIDFFSKFLEKKGFITKKIKCDGKNNLIATFNCNDDRDNDVILFSGHIDTVKTQISLWDSNPFELRMKENKIFGLGVCDMKCFFSFLMDNIDVLKEKSRSLVICVTSDEETSVKGIKKIVDYLEKEKIKPKYAILGEPTNNFICLNSKGCYEFKTTFFGKSCHSSKPENGINAIYAMSEFALFLKELNGFLKEQKGSINLGKISGGKSCNVVADRCSISWDLRASNINVINQTLKKINDKILIIREKYNLIDVKNIKTLNILPFENENSELYKKILNKFDINKISFDGGTEAGHFQKKGIDTIIFGPGNILQAHTANEFIIIDQYLEYKKNLIEIIKAI